MEDIALSDSSLLSGGARGQGVRETSIYSEDFQKLLGLSALGAHTGLLESRKEAETEEVGEPDESYGRHEGPQTEQTSDSHRPQEPSGPYTPLQARERDAPDQPNESQASRKPRAPHAPHKLLRAQQPQEHRRAVQVMLLPSIAAVIHPSLMARCPPGLRLSVLSANPDSYQFVRRCFFSRKRMQDLSRPKRQWGTPERRLFWGNQDPICPVAERALSSPLSKRLNNLAQPKKVSHHYVPNRSHFYYSCGRDSVIWKIPPAALVSQPSTRIQRLAQPNKFKRQHLQNGDHIARGPLHYSDPSPRILRLSVAKGTDPNYLPPRSVETIISITTLSAVATPRIIDLAHPRIKLEGLCYERERSEMPIRPGSYAYCILRPGSF